MHTYHTVVVLALWALPLLAWSLPKLASGMSDMWRSEGTGQTVFIIFVLIVMAYAYPSSASKSGGTNEPPVVTHPSASGRINLYYEDASGKLVPLGARIMESTP